MISTILQRTTVARSSLIIALITGLVAVGISKDVSAQRLKGKLADGTYTSPRGLFSVQVPKASNWAGVAFAIQEETETGDKNYDMVAFYVKDFGEVLLASVRRIPSAALENMAKDDPENVVKNLTNKALGDWRQNLAEEPDVVEEDLISTPYGQAAIRIYKVAKGSLLQKKVGNIGSTPVETLTSTPGDQLDVSRNWPDSFDVLIAVIAAKRDDHMISAIAEDDAHPLETNQLKTKLREFFGSVMVPQTPRFDMR